MVDSFHLAAVGVSRCLSYSLIHYLSMTRRRLLIVAISMWAVLTALGTFYLLRSNDAQAIATASVWARLAPLPPSAHGCRVEVKGSAFTREFVITFSASSPAVQQWIAASPGPASAQQTVAGGITVYAIKPGGGAEFAEVRVDSSTGTVVIRTYWS
jgi:hypothetical protein